MSDFDPLRTLATCSKVAPMRELTLVTGLAAGVVAVWFLGVAQLIWADSEASYYVQLALAVLLLASLGMLARRASASLLAIAVLATAFSTALLPVENGLVRLREEPSGLAISWLFYSVLLAVFAFGLRHWLRRNDLGLGRT